MKPLVIYHANCTDGFGAAYAAWAKLGDDAEYVPMHYGNPITQPVEGREVYILDFSFPKDVTIDLLDKADKVIWLDHHKTAFENWCGDVTDSFTQTEVIPRSGSKPITCHIYLDQHRSGAMLAWEYFHPDVPVPQLIRCIDDRDRWQFKFDYSKALHAALNDEPFSFERWHQLTPLGNKHSQAAFEVALYRGQSILATYDKQIKESVAKAEKCSIILDPRPSPRPVAGGLAVNTPQHISEVGNALAKASGTYGLVWYYDGATKRANCSLRSIGDYDVSAIAKVFGGGGHKNAAGFNVPMAQLLEWM